MASKDSSTTGRYYASETYLLPSDDEERARLDLQHKTFILHIPMLLPSGLILNHGDAILDAGTGTGIWADLVANLCPPTITVTGIDIESRLFPPTLPNTAYRVASSLDLPAEWTSTFAHVHQRLMIGAFSLDKWKSCIENFFRVLKPGGYIRLEEYDIYFAFDGYREPSPLHGQFIVALRALAESRGIAYDTLTKMTGLLEEAGFRDVQFTRSMLVYGGDDPRKSTMGAWRGMKAPFLQAGGLGLGATEAEFTTFMDSMDAELCGSVDQLPVVTWTAQKPL